MRNVPAGIQRMPGLGASAGSWAGCEGWLFGSITVRRTGENAAYGEARMSGLCVVGARIGCCPERGALTSQRSPHPARGADTTREVGVATDGECCATRLYSRRLPGAAIVIRRRRAHLRV